MKSSAQVSLALIVTAGYFFCIFYMLRFGFPPENKDQLNALMGVLTTIFTLIMNYYFGSSSSGKAKDEVIGEIAKAAPSTSSPVSAQNVENLNVDASKAAEK